MEAAAAAAEEEEKVFVAVPAEPRAGQSTLAWALRHLHGGAATTIVVMHVHVPAQMIPIMGVKFHADKLSPEPVRVFRRAERERADEMLDDYIHQCSQIKLVVEKEDAASGLVELIRLHGITKLVIAAAADRHYSRKLDKPVSKTATEIMQRADPSCKIWFVCKEQLVCTRDKEVQIAPSTVAAPLLPNLGHEVLDLQSPQEEGDTEMEPSFDDELEEARKAVEELMRRALKESCRRQKAEEETAASLHKAQEHEELYLEEVKKREELEAALARADGEIARLRQAIQQKHDRGGSHGEIDA
uniref:RING-type E3 ubiquitin transferase n=1 Tax=Aegilops tauschii subsp. strangulata TaxID=200361 RepID=A0A452YTF3_AEGTS